MVLYITVALLAGVFIVVSRVLNSRLAEEIGLFQGTLVNYISGLIVAGALLFILLATASSTVLPTPGLGNALDAMPFWGWLGGLTGVMVVVLSSLVTPKIPSFLQTLLVFIGQLFTGILIDYWMSGQMSLGKVIGGLLVLGGLIFNMDKPVDSSASHPSSATNGREEGHGVLRL